MTSNQIGRNSPCHCGSGRKYKKCCLYKSNQTLSEKEKLIISARPDRILAMRNIAEETICRIRNRKDWNTIEYEAEKVKITIEEIEYSAKKVFATISHSRQYWFVLIRRFSYLLFEELQESSGNKTISWENPVTLLAGKLTLLAVEDGEPAEWVEEEGRSGISYEKLGLAEMKVVAQVFSLAAAFFDAETKYRFACKGFQVFSTAEDDNILDSQDTASIRLYEERRCSFGTLSGSSGLWYDPLEISIADKDLCLWFGVSQVQPGTINIASINPPTIIQLNYFLSSHSEFYAQKMNFERRIPFDRLILEEGLKSGFKEAFSVDPRELVAFLYCISHLMYSILRFPRLEYGDTVIKINWEDENIQFRRKVLSHWKDVASLGMLRSSKLAWMEELLRLSQNIHAYDSSVPSLDYKTLDGLFDQFTWCHGDSVFDNTPRLFIKLSSKTLALDTTWLVDFMRHLLLQAGIASRESDKMSDVVGPWFELQARSFFSRELCLSNDQVVFQRNIKDKEGREEIDLAFVVDRCLFVIDCKAMAKTADYMAGEYSLLRNRKTEQLKQIRKRNPSRIRKIEAGLVSDRIKPDQFDRAYGLVCTTDVEYLPIEEIDMWVGPHACIGPPDELLLTIKFITQKDL